MVFIKPPPAVMTVIKDVDGALSSRFANPSTGEMVQVIIATALFMGLTDIGISRFGRRPITHFFGVKDRTSKQARRLVSQSAARIVGSIFLAAVLPLAFLSVIDPALHTDKLYVRSPKSTLMLLIAAGYFLYDVFLCTWLYRENGGAFLLHACCCFAAYSYSALGRVLHLYGAAFLMWELSTPFLYARWILVKRQMSDTRLYLATGLALMITFFLCRNVLGAVMSYDFFKVTGQELSHPRPKDGFPFVAIWVYRVINVVLNGLNAFWLYKMLALVVSAAAKGQKAAAAKDDAKHA